MTNTATISCILDTTDPTAELGFEAWVDNHKFYDIAHVESKQQVFIELPDDDSEHELKFILKNKTFDHTQLDKDGNIVTDAKLIVTDLAFDEIKLAHMVTQMATYTHDCNGTQPLITDIFSSEMGCNGTVSLKFSTPLYIWLLERM